MFGSKRTTVALTTLTALAAPAAQAQFGRILRRDKPEQAATAAIPARTGATTGSGQLQIGRDTTRQLDRASVLLKSGGVAELRFFRGSTPYIFTGTWQERRRNNVDLRLQWRDQQPITATGALTFGPDGELARILINGQERQTRLNLSFQCEAGSAPSSGPFDYIDAADKARSR